ncbi:MAG: diaminopimelate decarboxylase [Bacillota bacterium]|nr:MAG: diaminopimelate decarboxylase [Bacillota bacterium]
MELHGTATISANGHLAVGGVDTVTLAREYGTPLWVIDEEQFRRNCRAFRQAFSSDLFPAGAVVLFAAKSLLALAICRIVEEEGLSLDVVSGGELHTALAAGFPMDRVYFHGNNKTQAEIDEAYQAGIARFMVDNLHELDLLEGPGRTGSGTRSGAGRVPVTLRVTPGIDADTHDYVKTGQQDSKFGLDIAGGQAMGAVKRVLDAPHLDLKGLHCHVGSQLFTTEPYAGAAEVLMDFAAEVRRRTGWVPEEIDLGGGFGVRYSNGDAPLEPEAFARAISRAIGKKVSETGLPFPRVIVEPGRAISATAGWTLYTVGSIKEIPGIRTYVAVDGGMTDNPRPALYQAVYEACLANRAGETVDGRGTGGGRTVGGSGTGGGHAAAEVFTITGRCCESGDILIHDIALPRPVPGDILAVSCTGAYNSTMASNYNRLPRPAMVLVNRGQVDVIVERETYDDLVARERLPVRLRRRASARRASAG